MSGVVRFVAGSEKSWDALERRDKVNSVAAKEVAVRFHKFVDKCIPLQEQWLAFQGELDSLPRVSDAVAAISDSVSVLNQRLDLLERAYSTLREARAAAGIRTWEEDKANRLDAYSHKREVQRAALSARLNVEFEVATQKLLDQKQRKLDRKVEKHDAAFQADLAMFKELVQQRAAVDSEIDPGNAPSDVLEDAATEMRLRVAANLSKLGKKRAPNAPGASGAGAAAGARPSTTADAPSAFFVTSSASSGPVSGSENDLEAFLGDLRSPDGASRGLSPTEPPDYRESVLADFADTGDESDDEESDEDAATPTVLPIVAPSDVVAEDAMFQAVVEDPLPDLQLSPTPPPSAAAGAVAADSSSEGTDSGGESDTEGSGGSSQPDSEESATDTAEAPGAGALARDSSLPSTAEKPSSPAVAAAASLAAKHGSPMSQDSTWSHVDPVDTEQ